MEPVNYSKAGNKDRNPRTMADGSRITKRKIKGSRIREKGQADEKGEK